MREFPDRRSLKAESRALLADAQVSPKLMTALYLGLSLALNLLSALAGSLELLATFVNILTGLTVAVLEAGFILYCMAVRRGERAELLTLFDGFSFPGRIILARLAVLGLVFLGSLLFVVPGVIMAYRYRFTLANLCAHPELTVTEALHRSSLQTRGLKWQLFLLDLSYLGWGLLASLPLLIYYTALTQEVLRQTGMIAGQTWGAALLSLSAVLWVLISGGWSLVVSLFYLPHYQCTELGYFERAESAGAAAAGPDGLGGF